MGDFILVVDDEAANSGCSYSLQMELVAKVRKYQKFDRIVLRRASATISSNCGFGAFGLLFMKNKFNLEDVK